MTKLTIWNRNYTFKSLFCDYGSQNFENTVNIKRWEILLSKIVWNCADMAWGENIVGRIEENNKGYLSNKPWVQKLG